jgi:FtsH-binding integral membrane protein
MFGVSPAVIKALYNVNLYLGLGIFSLFISFDTQQMIHDAREGHKDHVSHAMNMFLNLINVFIRLLSIFRNND